MLAMCSQKCMQYGDGASALEAPKAARGDDAGDFGFLFSEYHLMKMHCLICLLYYEARRYSANPLLFFFKDV